MTQRRLSIESVLAILLVIFGFCLVGVKTPMDIGIVIGLFCVGMGIAWYMGNEDAKRKNE